jgi:hypothetical protein
LLDALPEKPEEIFKRAQADEFELSLPSISLGEAIYVFMRAHELKGEIAHESISGRCPILWGEYIKVEDLDFKDWKRITNLLYRDLTTGLSRRRPSDATPP